MKEFILTEYEDDFILKSSDLEERRQSLYPSEASVIVSIDGRDVVRGKCMRAAYYRATRVPKTNPAGASLMSKAHLGKWDENGLVERYKEMGIWAGNNIKFYDAERAISGEVDIVIRNPNEPEKRIGLECFTPDSLILCDDYSIKTIKDIVEDNIKSVISFRGKKDNILNYQIKDVANKDIYRLRGKFDGLEIRHTEEHPIEIANIKVTRPNREAREYNVVSTEWKKTKDIKKGDYICIPKLKFNSYKEILISDIDLDWKYRIIDNKIYSYSKNAIAQERGFPLIIKGVDLNDFHWFLGLYIAEGSCSNSSVYFSLHKDELEIIEKIKAISKKIFNLDISVRQIGNTKCVNVCISSKPLRQLIKKIIPGNSVDKTKRINYTFINENNIEELLKGIHDGDGSKGRTQYHISTCVHQLAYLYFHLAANIGKNPSINKNKQMSKFNSDYIYKISWSENKTKRNQEKLIDGGDFWCYKVKKIEKEKYTGKVYNFETEKTNTYQAGLISVHNCKTFYGHMANNQICGSKGRQLKDGSFSDKQPRVYGAPKIEHFLQSCLYSHKYVTIDKKLSEFRLFYLERGDGHRVEFRVGTDAKPDGTYECWYEQIPGKYWSAFKKGKVYMGFTIGDVYKRYADLLTYLRKNELPPKDFSDRYTDDEVEWAFDNKEISKTKYEDWKNKNKPVGDWQCSWCPYKDKCRLDG